MRGPQTLAPSLAPALALALALVVGPALADHVYSHRFVFEGRLVGNDGAPLPGREIEFFSEKEDFLEPCREGPHQSVTDESGDFRFCYHHHALSSGARAGVRAGNASVLRPVDIAFRRTVVNLREPNETGIEPPGWEGTYRISGRAWTVGPTELEGVAVYGEAAIGVPVNLTVRLPDGGESVFRTVTDGFGDFDLVVETEAAPGNVSLTLELLGRTQPTALDPFFHRTYAPVYLPGETGSVKTEENAPPDGSFPDAPGSASPRMNPVLVVALALGLVAAILLSRRKKA